MVQSSKKKAVSAGSVLTYSLKVDGPTNLKSLRVNSVEVLSPEFPVFPAGQQSLMPNGFPGTMLLTGTDIVLAVPPGDTGLFVWNGISGVLPLTAFNGTTDTIEMTAVLAQADYVSVALAFKFTGLVTSTAFAAGIVRNVILRLVDKTTGLVAIGTQSPLRVPSGPATINVDHTFMTGLIPISTWDLDPDRDWQIQLSCAALVAAETITFDNFTVEVCMVNARVNPPV